MKNLLFDKEDVEYLKEQLSTKLENVEVAYTFVRLKEMQPNKDTLRIIRENKLQINSSMFEGKRHCPDCFGKSSLEVESCPTCLRKYYLDS